MKSYRFIVFSIIVLLSIHIVSAKTYTSFIKIVGVDNEGRGVIGNVTVEVQPGKGRVLVDTEPLQGIDLQHSERTAVKVAEDVTGFNFSDYDVIYTIRTPRARIVEGPSAGGALTLATIAAVEEKEINPAFAMTGTIQEDNSIGPVGAILAKAKAAADSGVTVFLIPKGQAIQTQYVKKVERPAPGWYIETVEPVPVNVIDYAKEHWDLTVYEVSNIREAMKYAFGTIPTKNITIPTEKNISLPQFISNVPSYKLFARMREDEVSRAEKSYQEAKNKLESASVLSSDTKTALNSILKNSELNLNRSKEALEKGYEYTAANYAFKSLINSKTVMDLIEYYSSSEKTKLMQESLLKAKQELNRVKEKIESKTASIICDPKNFEWAVGARERITYAENKLNSIQTPTPSIKINEIVIGGTDPMKFFTDINVAKEWIEISKSFASSATGSGESSCLSMFKEDSQKLLSSAEKEVLIAKGLNIQAASDAEWYLNAAKKEFSEGWYITAIYDAQSARIRASTGVKYEGKEVNEIYQEFNRISFKPKSLMSTIYLEHSSFLIYKAQEKNSKSDAAQAMELLELSKSIDEEYSRIMSRLTNPVSQVSWSFNLRLTEREMMIILIVAIVAIGLYTLNLRFKVRKLERGYKKIKPKKKLSKIEKEMKGLIEKKLKEKLKKKEITRKEYKKLKEKLLRSRRV